MPRSLIPVPEAARRFQRSTRTITNWIGNAAITGYRTEDGLCVDPAEIEFVLSRRKGNRGPRDGRKLGSAGRVVDMRGTVRAEVVPQRPEVTS